MLIVYASRTGNIKRFVGELGLDEYVASIDSLYAVNEPFILLTYTDKFGQVPEGVGRFLDRNNQHLIGVSASGNKNWGTHLFAKSADIISKKYDVPIILKFEMSGSKGDVEKFREGVFRLYGKMD